MKRFVDLTTDETSDLWIAAQKVGSRLETYHKASSLTLTIQVSMEDLWFFPIDVNVYLFGQVFGYFSIEILRDGII